MCEEQPGSETIFIPFERLRATRRKVWTPTGLHCQVSWSSWRELTGATMLTVNLTGERGKTGGAMAAEERSDGATGPETARKESEHERLTTGVGADHSGPL